MHTSCGPDCDLSPLFFPTGLGEKQEVNRTSHLHPKVICLSTKISIWTGLANLPLSFTNWLMETPCVYEFRPLAHQWLFPAYHISSDVDESIVP